MNKLCTFGGATVCSYLGWFLATPLGLGWAFALSGAASVVGVWLGWRLAQRLA